MGSPQVLAVLTDAVHQDKSWTSSVVDALHRREPLQVRVQLTVAQCDIMTYAVPSHNRVCLQTSNTC